LSEIILDVADLHVTFNTPAGAVRAVRGVSLDVERGEILGVVGESGCGKSVTFRSLLGLAPRSATVSGSVTFKGNRVATDGELRQWAALVYQNPGAALNPVFTIGQQLKLVGGADEEAVVDLLTKVGLPDPKGALNAYPHEFSGGMRQRAVIAYALAQQPDILIADEPTTALDVTTQAQILDLFRDLRDETNLTIVFISHDLAVIRQLCDRIAVLYAGQLVEIGTTNDVLSNPTHPYTRALLASTPRADNVGTDLASIPGSVPDGRSSIAGCAYAPRCEFVTDVCTERVPLHVDIGRDHRVSCILAEAPT